MIAAWWWMEFIWRRCDWDPDGASGFVKSTKLVVQFWQLFWCCLVRFLQLCSQWSSFHPAHALFAILLQIWQVSGWVGGWAGGGLVCLRISKYERQMGIPSLHSLSLCPCTSLFTWVAPSLGRWSEENSGTLLICCSTWLQRYKRGNINLRQLHKSTQPALFRIHQITGCSTRVLFLVFRVFVSKQFKYF